MENRIKVLKTNKIFIGGAFPRTESGRYYTHTDNKGNGIANICLSSRKDVRNAVVAARKAQGSWSSKTAYNRAQIIYRIAEIIEGRAAQFIDEIQQQNFTKKQAEAEVYASIDRLIYFAGWCDKYQQIFSSVNPVASSHFNFSVLEAVGLVACKAPEKSPLLGLISAIAPVIAGGNTCIVLASYSNPLCASSLSEAIATSDVPGGVVNILTGEWSELKTTIANHMDLNAIAYFGNDTSEITQLQSDSCSNLKRIKIYTEKYALSTEFENPYIIKDFQEIKTTWHPIEKIGAGAGGY
jgi:acyl-CoA reductase-like NAD-dependent aldehyde dehydrogenase